MAERVEFDSTFDADAFRSRAAADDYYGLFDPGRVIGSMQKGDESNPDWVSGSEFLQGGGWGLPSWDDLWGADGRAKDPTQLLLAMNAGSLFNDWTTIRQAHDTYGGGAYQGLSSGEAAYAGGGNPYAAIGMDFLDDLFGGENHSDMKNAYRNSFANALDSGVEADLLNLMMDFGKGPTFNDFNSTINAWEERYIDPNNVMFKGYDLGGIDLRTATLDELNAWAEATYGPGADLLTVAASNADLLGARQDFMQNPGAWFDPSNPGQLLASTIPGLRGDIAAERLAAFETEYANRQNELAQLTQQHYADLYQNMLMSDPELMRTAEGRRAAEVGGYQQALAGQSMAMTPGPSDYSFLFGAGVAPEMVESALAQIRMQGG